MKLIITALLGLFYCITDAQNPSTSKIGLYRWKEVVMMQPSNLDGTKAKDNNGNDLHEIPSKAGQKFRVVKIVNGTALLQILDYTKERDEYNSKASPNKHFQPTTDFFKYNFFGTLIDYNNLSAEDANSRNYKEKQAYFNVNTSVIDDETLTTRESKIGGALAAGVINFPFKYRPQKNNTDFSGAFNFGAGIGYKFPHKNWRQFTYSAISGYSISNVTLDSSNANKNQGQLSSTNNFTAFSFSLGLLAEYQRVQAGIFLGWDKIGKLNQRQFEWQYQGRPWISVGFGLAIFAGQKEKATDNSSQNSQ